VHSYVSTYGIPAVIVRPFNNYGPYQHLEKLVPRFITSCILGEPMTIHGDGRAARDWVFVEDTVRGVDRALSAPIDLVKGEVFNLGTERSISVLEIAGLVADMMGGPDPRIEHVDDRLGQVVRHIASGAKARKLLDFSPAVSFEEGLRRTIEWYVANPQWWRRLLALRRVPVKLGNGSVIWY
jgi:dTDP-glucose 4,6-dehydratase